MHIILLSGGSGTRLWPLSNGVRSKQFLKLFRSSNTGENESMIQRVYGQLRKLGDNVHITIATAKSQISAIYNQLGKSVDISMEPCRRDTFPAIALASMYLKDMKNVALDEVVVVCPVDPYVEEDYFIRIKQLGIKAKCSDANLLLLGITPTFPSSKYGYIIPESSGEVSKVRWFREKPDEAMAAKYIKQGALWNGGIFAFKLNYMVDVCKNLLGTSCYSDLFANYENLKKVSFDYAVVEKEKAIEVLRFSGKWMDIGSWNTLTETMDKSLVGFAVVDDISTNVHIINELDIPILAMGIHNLVIAASPDGILVAYKSESGNIKKYVEEFQGTPMFAEKSWGNFQIIDVEKDSITIKVDIKAGDHMNYHSHAHRDEVWTVISGVGRTIVDGMEQEIKPGDVITMEAGCRHTVFAKTDLKLIEVQLGKEINVHDKQKYSLEL